MPVGMRATRELTSTLHRCMPLPDADQYLRPGLPTGTYRALVPLLLILANKQPLTLKPLNPKPYSFILYKPLRRVVQLSWMGHYGSRSLKRTMVFGNMRLACTASAYPYLHQTWSKPAGCEFEVLAAAAC